MRIIYMHQNVNLLKHIYIYTYKVHARSRSGNHLAHAKNVNTALAYHLARIYVNTHINDDHTNHAAAGESINPTCASSPMTAAIADTPCSKKPHHPRGAMGECVSR